MENNNFVKYKDLLTIKEYDEETNKDSFVFLPLEDEYVVGIYKKGRNMLEYSKHVPVRKKVYLKLIEVAKKAKQINPNYKMVVVYGYRDMKKQNRNGRSSGRIYISTLLSFQPHIRI